MQQPGSPGSGPDALPVPIPLSPSAVGITSLQVKVASSSDGDGASSPSWRHDSPQAQMDWQLGTLPGWAAAAAAAAAEGPVGRPGREGPAGGSASLYCLLGKLYCAARAELLRLGAAAGLDLPKAATAVPGMAEPRQHVLPPPAAAAGAAAPAMLPSEAAAAQQTAAAAAEAAGRAGWQAEEGLQDVPSATDLAQVDLTGPATSSSEQELQAGAAAGPVFSPAPSADQAAASLKLSSPVEGQADVQTEAASSAPSGGGPPGASPRQVAPAPLQRISVRSKAGGDAGERPGASKPTHCVLRCAPRPAPALPRKHALRPAPQPAQTQANAAATPPLSASQTPKAPAPTAPAPTSPRCSTPSATSRAATPGTRWRRMRCCPPHRQQSRGTCGLLSAKSSQSWRNVPVGAAADLAWLQQQHRPRQQHPRRQPQQKQHALLAAPTSRPGWCTGACGQRFPRGSCSQSSSPSSARRRPGATRSVGTCATRRCCVLTWRTRWPKRARRGAQRRCTSASAAPFSGACWGCLLVSRPCSAAVVQL